MLFDVWYETPDGSTNHETIEAKHMSSAIDYVESVKGGEVVSATRRSTTKSDVGAAKFVIG